MILSVMFSLHMRIPEGRTSGQGCQITANSRLVNIIVIRLPIEMPGLKLKLITSVYTEFFLIVHHLPSRTCGQGYVVANITKNCIAVALLCILLI